MRIAFVTENFAPWEGTLLPGGCAYYRQMLPRNVVPDAAFGQPAWTAQHGFGVRGKDGKATFGFDVVVFKHLMERWIPEQMRQAQALGQRIIVDVDDSYQDLNPDNIAYHATNPEQNRVRNRDVHEQVVLAADMVTVSTPYLYELYADRHPNVRLVRNGVNPNQFPPHKHTSRKPLVGWVGSIQWRSGDVETCRDWLPGFLDEHDLQFLHSGHMPDAQSFAALSGVDPARMLVAGMLPLTHYHNLLQMDIGLVLLADIPFNEAKSTIKGLEYAASGIPFVAQALPEYTRLAGMGVGSVASTPAEWRAQLLPLLDYSTRRKRAAEYRRLALRDHSITARAAEWLFVFQSMQHATAAVPSVVIPYAA